MAAACAAAGFLAFAWFNPSGPGFTGGTDGIFLLPRGDLTPGVARDVALGDICGGDPRVALRPIPADVHRSVFDAYGADYGRADDYELDQLITPELGGTQDPANLWPQTYTSTQWNAWVKDELERLLHQRVCEGSMTLAAAQQEMASDWIAAYKRHLDTDTPLRDYLKYPPTEHDRELLLSELAERGVTAPRDTASILTAARRAGVRFVAFTPDR